MSKTTVGEVLRAHGGGFISAFRYKVPTALYSLVFNALHEVKLLQKARRLDIQPIKCFLEGGCQIQFARDMKVRDEQQKLWSEVFTNYLCWWDDSANVWKVEKPAK